VWLIVGAHVHRPELQHREHLAVSPDTTLTEQDRPGRAMSDEDSNEQQQGRSNYDAHGCDANVHGTPICTAEKTPLPVSVALRTAHLVNVVGRRIRGVARRARFVILLWRYYHTDGQIPIGGLNSQACSQLGP
jgi:hypothetical protein